MTAIRSAGEAAVLIELGDAIAPEITDRVLRLTAALEAAAIPGVTDLAPGYVTVLVLFDPAMIDADALTEVVRQLAAAADQSPLPPGKVVTIPVAYGGDLGPDLADVAAHAGLTTQEVVARHAEAEYRVACPGFVPGWAYLGGLPSELATPRRTTPRTRVPVGSVAIGGAQTGVYPFETPGGWNLIGRSPVRLFDPSREEPSLLLAGDRVRFVPISAAEYHGSAQQEEPHPEATRGDRASTPARPNEGRADSSVQVVSPGLLTTVQDLGRPGRMRHGIGREGALDRAALMLGNRLVGNESDAAGLEITLVGPRLRFAAEAVVAVTGADLGATLEGQVLPRWQSVRVPAGGEVAFEPGRAAGHGARAYLCVAGGIDVPVVLGSRSTYLAIGIGGHEGRALRSGDSLSIGQPSAPVDALLRRRLAWPPPDYPVETIARVVLGPQDDRFTTESIRLLLSEPYRASARSDRMGLRLEDGPPLEHRDGADLISEGIVPGSIQVPGDARPIVLLHAAATAGGYPKVATVIGADLDRLGQVRPGDRVRFLAISADAGRLATLAYRTELGKQAVVEGSRVGAGWAPADGSRAADGGSSLDGRPGIDRLADSLRATRFRSISIELRAGRERVNLTLRRRDD